MRIAPQRISPAKRYLNPTFHAQSKNGFNFRLDSAKTFMHYNNAIYMGGMTSFKRSGFGIVLIDDGTSGIIESSYDSLIGHNIFFTQDSIASVLHIKKGSYEIALRTGHFILKVPFHQQDGNPNGNGILIDYQQFKIYHLVYQNGKLVKKIVETNQNIINQITRQNLTSVLDSKHIKAFDLNIEFDNGISVQKKKNTINIGYFDNYNNLNGICFKLAYDENLFQDFSTSLSLKCSQRGLYKLSKLQNYGQRCFQNGNLFIGSFQNDCFQGFGLLLYSAQNQTQQNKWVYGQFQNDKLVKMVDMSIGQKGEKPEGKIKKNIKTHIKSIHKSNTKNWMNVNIDLIDWILLFRLFQQSLFIKVTDVVIEKERLVRQQEERLYRIQKHFSAQNQNKEINKVLLTQKHINKISQQRIFLKENAIFRPKILTIEPRSIQNQEYWSLEKKSNLNQEKKSTFQKRFNLRQYTDTSNILSTQFSSLEKLNTTKNVSPLKNNSFFSKFPKYYKKCQYYETTNSMQD